MNCFNPFFVSSKEGYIGYWWRKPDYHDVTGKRYLDYHDVTGKRYLDYHDVTGKRYLNKLYLVHPSLRDWNRTYRLSGDKM